MAKIGLEMPKYSVLDANETLSVGKAMAKFIKVDIKINTNSAILYADNNVDESVTEFKDGAITQEVNDLLDDVTCDLLGCTKTQDGTTMYKDGDVAPFVRLGFITSNVRQNKPSFTVTILNKVQYNIPDETYETKGESLKFSTTTIVGKIFRDKNGCWKMKKTFDTKEEAIKYLDEMVGIVKKA